MEIRQAMSKWSEYYEKRVGYSYAKYAAKRYAPMIKELIKDGETFREEGCGIGTISKVLIFTKPELDIEICDLDKDILELASINMAGLLKPEQITQQDAIIAPDTTKDVIFSHGVIEYFEDDNIGKILARQLKLAGKVVHYVPTDGYDNPSFGDERLLPYDYWLNKWEPTRYELFNDNKDLLLVWEK